MLVADRLTTVTGPALERRQLPPAPIERACSQGRRRVVTQPRHPDSSSALSDRTPQRLQQQVVAERGCRIAGDHDDSHVPESVRPCMARNSSSPVMASIHSSSRTISGWRMPALPELWSLVDWNLTAPPFIDLAAFPGTDDRLYFWTSSTYGGWPGITAARRFDGYESSTDSGAVGLTGHVRRDVCGSAGRTRGRRDQPLLDHQQRQGDEADAEVAASQQRCDPAADPQPAWSRLQNREATAEATGKLACSFRRAPHELTPAPGPGAP